MTKRMTKRKKKKASAKGESSRKKLVAELKALLAKAVEIPQAQIVIQMSNDGGYDVRAITVDQRHVVQPFSTTQARTVIDITPHFHPPTRIGWWIVPGVQFPKAGIFLVRPDRSEELLDAEQPLKKGVAWVGETDVE